MVILNIVEIVILFTISIFVLIVKWLYSIYTFIILMVQKKRF